MAIEPTAEEQALDTAIRDVYNSGRGGEAVEMSKVFLTKHPNSILARYDFAVMHGDYSYSPELSTTERVRLREIAKKGVSELLNDPQLSEWPLRFQQRVRNEYYWFHEMPKEQYELGLEILKAGQNGHYSACVGSSMLAEKELHRGSIAEAERWARICLEHFAEFEKVAPHWYNINHFASQAFGCLGQYERALLCFKDMYRKQQGPERADEVAEFCAKLALLRKARGD